MADQTFTLGVEIDTGNAVSGLKDLQKELDKTAQSAKDAGKGFGESIKGIQTGISGLTDSLTGLSGRNGVGGVVDSIGSMTSGMGLAAGAVVSLTAVVGTATIALIANSSAMAAAADNAAELADKYGITTTELATFDLLASENGTTTAGLISTYDRLTKSLDEISNGNLNTENSFRRLGISMSDLAGKSKQEIAGVVIANYEALGRTTQATAAVQDILGRSFREQIPAIKEASNNLDEYNRRVVASGAVATQALVDAGGRQEKAFSDLTLATTGLKNSLAELFSGTTVDAANWATSIIGSVNRVIKNLSTPNVSLAERITIEREEFAKLSIIERMSIENQRKVNQRIQERVELLGQQREAIKRGAEIGGGRGVVNPPLVNPVTPLPDKVKPKKEKVTIQQEKLSEEQKNVIAFTNAMRSAFNDLDRQLAVQAETGDVVNQQMATMAYRLFDAGKGVVDYATSLQIVVDEQDKFRKILEQTNTIRFNEDVKSLNESYQQELDLLKATTDQQREQIRLRNSLSKNFANQAGGITVEQARALEDALKKANDQYAILQQQRISNGVRDSMRDLADQSRDLAFETEHFWAVNKDGLVNTRLALQALEKQIDPEGRGKNITDAQRAQLQAQIAVIEEQKRVLELNGQIAGSFRDLGSAVTQWQLNSKDGIRAVRLELLRLIALQALKTYGGQAGTVTNSFLSGVISGLSGARAEGGPVMAGRSYLVGEKGPEVVKFDRPGYVIPNNQISTTTGRVTNVTLAPSLIIQGSVTGQSELDRAFEEFANAMASEQQKYMIDQRGRGILAR